MIKTNHHTHCYLCQHAQGLPSDYIKLSLAAGYQEIGISDHGPLFKQW
ncbi:MAG: PHP domain-containing protein, partial [Bacilli bacterium]|nr:PHP domain-containing protein [Bacilli bacterium]